MVKTIVAFVLAMLVAGCAGAQVDPPPHGLVMVVADEIVELLREPDLGAAKVGELAPNEVGIAVTAQASDSLDWVQVSKDGIRGWADANALAYEGTGGQLPIRLHCTGTEPFWGLELSYSRVDVAWAGSDQSFTTGVGAPNAPQNRPDVWLMTDFLEPSGFLLIESRTCSDGMSDRAYRFSLVARMNQTLLSGCCV